MESTSAPLISTAVVGPNQAEQILIFPETNNVHQDTTHKRSSLTVGTGLQVDLLADSGSPSTISVPPNSIARASSDMKKDDAPSAQGRTTFARCRKPNCARHTQGSSDMGIRRLRLLMPSSEGILTDSSINSIRSHKTGVLMALQMCRR